MHADHEMQAAARTAEGVLVDDAAQFFAPSSTDMLDSLLGEYRAFRAQIEHVAHLCKNDFGGVMHYFVNGNSDQGARYAVGADKLFEQAGAVAALNAAFWSKALSLTDVLDVMPQKRRDEWNKSICNPHGIRAHRGAPGDWEVAPLPDFTEEAVRPTIRDLLASRQRFFCERVDGVFRSLSGEHVTNAPQGFGKRMIIGYMLSDFGSVNHSRSGVINDLRAVIAKFMGRDEPGYQVSYGLVDRLKRQWGEWVSIDGGALRIRLYKKGTAHLEVHPDMAWRLNQVLASMYPLAIPPEFRTKPKRQPKELKPIQRPLPFAVVGMIASMQRERRNENVFRFPYDAKTDGAAYQEALRVLMMMGGVLDRAGMVAFDYDPREAIDEIALSGCIPDQKSHQFYPTPASVAAAAIEAAQIGADHLCLEPSAGTGALADLMPKERTRCVEISALHCAVLRAKGFDVVEADFILWADLQFPGGCHFDRVVMNPPFADGRAKLHTEYAYGLLKPGGRLVAILPASMRGKAFLPDCTTEWSRTYDNEFAGTSVSVTIMTVTKQ
jgi:hypothetical protein